MSEAQGLSEALAAARTRAFFEKKRPDREAGQRLASPGHWARWPQTGNAAPNDTYLHLAYLLLGRLSGKVPTNECCD